MAYDMPFAGPQSDTPDAASNPKKPAAPAVAADPSWAAFLQHMIGGQGPTVPNPPRSDPNAGTGSSFPASSVPAGGSQMRIQNGQNIQDILYGPSGNGGVQATTMRDANTGSTFGRDAGSGNWYTAGSPTGGPGMSFGDAQSVLQGTMPDQTGLAARQLLKSMTPALQNDPAAIARAMEQVNANKQLANQTTIANADATSKIGELGLKQQQIDINRLLANDKNDPKSLQTQHAIQLLAQNPNLTIPQIMAQTAKLGQVMQSVGGTSSQPTAASPAATVTQPWQPKDLVGVEQQKMQSLGPQVYEWLNQPVSNGNGANLAASAMQNIYRYDQQHHGYMQRVGPEVMNLLKQNYGQPAVGSFLSSPFQSLNRVFNPLHDATDEDLAREAFRAYLGKNGRMFGKMIGPGGQ